MAGKVTDTAILESSKSESYEKSIKDSLRNLKLDPLPSGLHELQLFLSFRADSRWWSFEFAQIPEADNYYSDLVGGVVWPPRMIRYRSSHPPRVNS